MRAYLLDEGDKVRMLAPYVKEFVDEMRVVIPRWAKEFEPDTKHWLIDRAYEGTLREAMSEYFEVERVVTEAEAIRRSAAAAKLARERAGDGSRPAHSYQQCVEVVRRLCREEAELHVFPGAPLAVIEAAYRAIAKMVHPDLVGSAGHARMVSVNLAYETLRKRLGNAS